jgi:TP901 family phage tail tape measure protein
LSAVFLYIAIGCGCQHLQKSWTLETRELLLLINVVDDQLKEAEATIAGLGKGAGVSADQLKKVDSALKSSAKSFSTLSTEAQAVQQRITVLQNKSQGLQKALKGATNPNDIKGLSAALKQVEKDLEAAIKDAIRLDKATDGVGSTAKKTGGLFGGIGKGLDLGGLYSKLGGLSGGLANLGLATGGATGGLLSMAASAGPVGAAIAGTLGVVLALGKGLSASVDIAKEYESSLASLSAITGLSGNSLDDLSDRAQNFTIRITDAGGGLQMITLNASQAAQAFEVVGSKAPELLKVPSALDAVTKQALVLSETSRSLGFDEAVAGLTTSINQFLPVADEQATAQERANQIVKQGAILTNQLAAAQQLGAVPVTGLAQSLEKFGAVATANNISSAESIALAETLGQKFSDQATVGTNLRNIISILAADTTSLGVSFKGADGEAQGIQGSIEALRAKLEGITDPAERAAFLTKQFGRENAAAAQILVTNVEQTAKLTAELEKQAERTLANGAAAQQAAINADTYEKSQERLRNTLTQVGNKIGQSLLPILKSLTDFINDVIRRADELGEGLKPLKDAFGVLIDTISSLIGELGLAGGETDFLGIAFAILREVLEAVTAGMTIAVKAVTGLVNWYRILATVVRAGIAVIGEFSDTVKRAFDGDFTAFVGLGDRLKGAFLKEMEDVDKILAPTVNEVTNKLENIITDKFNSIQFGGDATGLASQIEGTIKAAIDGVDPEKAAEAMARLGPTIRAKIDDALDRKNINLEQAAQLQAELEKVIGGLVPDAVDPNNTPEKRAAAEAEAAKAAAEAARAAADAKSKADRAAAETLNGLQQQLIELKKERLELPIGTAAFNKVNAEIQAIETKVKTLKGEVKVQLTPDEKKLNELLEQIQSTEAQVKVAVAEGDDKKVSKLQSDLKILSSLEAEARVKIQSGPFTDELKKITDELNDFKAQAEAKILQVSLGVAIDAGDSATAIRIQTQLIEAEAQKEIDQISENTTLKRLAIVDPGAAADLEKQLLNAIEKTKTDRIDEATKKIGQQVSSDFVENILTAYSEKIAGSSSEFQALADSLRGQIVALGQSLDVVQSTQDVAEARSILAALGLDASTIPADVATVEAATEAIQSQIKAIQGQLLSENQTFASSFIGQTQATIAEIGQEIAKLEALQADGSLSDEDAQKLEGLRTLYQRLSADVGSAREEVVQLAEEVNSLNLSAFEEAFKGASSEVKNLGEEIIAAGAALGKEIDPELARKLGQGFLNTAKIINGVQETSAAFFEFRLQKAEQTNAEELKGIDEQIAEAETRQRKGAAGQEKILESLKNKRIELEEEQEREIRKVKEKQFKVDKAFNLVTAVMNGALAFTKALSSAAPPVNFILAGLSAAATAAQIATIVSAKPSFFEGTPFVSAAVGKGGKDSVDARLHHGERVVTASQNKKHFNDFTAIDGGGLVPDAAAALANMPAKVQRMLMKQPDAFIRLAMGGDDQFTQVSSGNVAKAGIRKQLIQAITSHTELTTRLNVEAERLLTGHRVPRAEIKGRLKGIGINDTQSPVVPRLRLTQQAEDAIRSQHMDMAGMSSINYGKLAGMVAEKISERLPDAMYKMQHRDSSVDKYQLDTLRHGLSVIAEKLEDLNKKQK